MQMFTRSLFGAGEDGLFNDRWDCDLRAMRSDRASSASRQASGRIEPEDKAASLLRTIEAEIIPRLMLAHRPPSNDDIAPADPAASAGPEQVAELTEIILHRDPSSASAYVRGWQSKGLSIERTYLDLLAPTAQRLGALWEADLCDFTQVTVGLWRLQQIVYEHSGAFRDSAPAESAAEGARRRAMIVPAPGSQHTFGVFMVGEFFRRAGWAVWGDPLSTVDDMASALRGEWFDVVGLSVGSECHVDATASAILALRKTSLNPDVVVMVGGPIVASWANFVQQVGADATAADAADAVAEAERLVALRQASS